MNSSATLAANRDLRVTSNLQLAVAGANVGRDLIVSGGTLTGGCGTVFVFRKVNFTGSVGADVTPAPTLLSLDGTTVQTVTQATRPLGAVTVNNTGALHRGTL